MPEHFSVGVEVGAEGYSAAWCFELPGCYALVPPGADVVARTKLAILEFMVWSHNRSADRIDLDHGAIEVVQTVTSGVPIRAGASSAFFAHDIEPPNGKEFPMWANAHDLAMDEFRAFAQDLPQGLLEMRLEGQAQTMLDVLVHTAKAERAFANQLVPGHSGEPKPGADGALRFLGDTHALLQQVVCDVPGAMRVRREAPNGEGGEDWSVRKAMRRSIQHLRYHAWALRRSISGIWVE